MGTIFVRSQPLAFDCPQNVSCWLLTSTRDNCTMYSERLILNEQRAFLSPFYPSWVTCILPNTWKFNCSSTIFLLLFLSIPMNWCYRFDMNKKSLRWVHCINKYDMPHFMGQTLFMRFMLSRTSICTLELLTTYVGRFAWLSYSHTILNLIIEVMDFLEFAIY